MRTLLLFLAATTTTVLTATSCSRSSSPAPDNGCIQRIVIKQSDAGLSPEHTRTADSLFDVNHIDHRNYRYYAFQSDTFQTLYSPFKKYDEKVIRLDQYVNGLRIFNGEINYIFWDGALHYIAGKPIQSANLDTISSLSLRRLRTMFTSELLRPGANVTPEFTDSCYKAEFGYFNLSNDLEPEKLVKAWRVTINYSSASWYAPYGYGYPYDGYPAAYYKDNGQLIGFAGNIIN